MLDALQLASKQNRSIVKSDLEIGIKEEFVKDVKKQRLPDVAINGIYSRTTSLTEFKGPFLSDRAIRHLKPEIYSLSTVIKSPIYIGGKIKNDIQIAKISTEIAAVVKEQVESDIQLDVISTYYGIYKMLKLHSIFLENISEAKTRLKEIRSFQSHGTVTKNEVIRAELLLSDRELNVMTNSNNIKIAMHNFKTLLQLPEEMEFSIDTTAINFDLKVKDPYATYYARALYNEDIRMSDKFSTIKKLELKNTRSNYYPSIYFFANYNLRFPNFMFFPPDPYLYSIGQVGIELNYNLSSLFKNTNKVHIAEKEVSLQKMNTQILKERVGDELFKNHVEYQEILDKSNVVDKALVLANENYRIVKVKYINQLVLSTEMIDADNELLLAKYNKISNRIDAMVKYYEMLHTAGALGAEFENK
ncbi:TolC family protein [Flavobacterium sp. 7A]|uniref:TolC family protein n=1 Tax=Flavobacterium sp. 7A TaxID=2940571 RepID=UPI002226A6FE|nr:TolC family protein [Flavobacterium sp. 7A]MCW2121209.1 outer membrane protein TolC [Flavobacterium sp. 7A]